MVTMYKSCGKSWAGCQRRMTCRFISHRILRKESRINSPPMLTWLVLDAAKQGLTSIHPLLISCWRKRVKQLSERIGITLVIFRKNWSNTEKISMASAQLSERGSTQPADFVGLWMGWVSFSALALAPILASICRDCSHYCCLWP